VVAALLEQIAKTAEIATEKGRRRGNVSGNESGKGSERGKRKGRENEKGRGNERRSEKERTRTERGPARHPMTSERRTNGRERHRLLRLRHRLAIENADRTNWKKEDGLITSLETQLQQQQQLKKKTLLLQ